jgi:hypothetical protein
MVAAYYVYNKKRSKIAFLMAQDLSNQPIVHLTNYVCCLLVI